MKNHTTTLALACLALVALCTSCLGSKVDNLTLFEPAQLTWPAVEEDFERGLTDGLEDGDLVPDSAEALSAQGDELGLALEQKDRDALRAVPWAALRPWAERGISDKLSDGEVGPGVAASLREQLANFDKTMNRLRGVL